MTNIIAAIKSDWSKRSWWMNLVFYFCLYMTFIYMPFDLFWKPVAVDHEVWFGLTLTGWWAKATEPLHWLIYGAGAFGFWKTKSWMWPWVAVYVAQVAMGMFVWNVISEHGRGVFAGFIAAGIFAVPMVALWRARATFGNVDPSNVPSTE